MLRRQYGIIVLAILIIFGIVIYAVFVKQKKHTLEIRDTVSGRVYGKWPLEENGEFAIEFIHSVHQSPVRESFIIEDGMIRPMAVRFVSFGAGMPSELEEGQTLSWDENAVLVKGFSASYKELQYIVGTVSDHVLDINGKTVSLRDLCGRNAHVSIRYFGGNNR